MNTSKWFVLVLAQVQNGTKTPNTHTQCMQYTVTVREEGEKIFLSTFECQQYLVSNFKDDS